jgi:hypothetical protein
MERESRVRTTALTALLLLLVGAHVVFAQGEGARRALLIGNTSYRAMAPLPSASTDARLMARMLDSLAFQTRVVENATLDQLDQAIVGFTGQIARGDTVVVYIAAYGVQVQGENYLLGVDFDPARQIEIDYAAYSLRRAVSDIESRGARLTAILLDAAYDEPALRRRYPQPGLAPMTPSHQGTLLGLSVAPNQSVPPAAGKVSLYARALIESLAAPGVEITEAFADVKRKVNLESGGRQVPVEMSTVVTEFSLNPKPEDELAWERIAGSNDPDALKDFVARYPRSPRAGEARSRLAAAVKPAPQPPPAPAPAANEPDDRTLAQQALRDYQRAFETRNVESLKAVWPSLGADEVERFEQFFRTARTIRLKLDPEGEPTTSGDTLTWVCKRMLEVSMDRGSVPVQQNRVTVRLKRDGPRMVIESMAVGR